MNESLTRETELKEAINKYYSTLNELYGLKVVITKQLLRPEDSMFTESILDNRGLTFEETFGILKDFIKE